MSDNRRRIAVEKALGRARTLGITVDTDPVFEGLIDRWIRGELSMREARGLYIAHIKERDQARSDWRALSIQAGTARIRAALQKRESQT